MSRFAGAVLFLLALVRPMVLGQSARPDVIERVEIRGHHRIPEDTIRFYIQTRPGEYFDLSQLELDLRALHKANFFETIEVEARDGDTGRIITFVVKEKPLIRSIIYEGNKSFTKSGILEHFKTRKVGLTVDSQYDGAKIRAAERALKELMEQNGKPLGTVRSEIENIPPSSVVIRFVIDEGPKVRIGEIRFTGNKTFDDNRLRQALKLTRERGLRTVLDGTDKYHRARLEADIEINLKQFYKEHGYVKVQVGEPMKRIFAGDRGILPVIRKTEQQFLLEIPIEAGGQYRLNEIKIVDARIFEDAALVKVFGLEKGDIVNLPKIKDALERIKKLYQDAGYVNWSYLTEQLFDEKNKTISMTFTFIPDTQFAVSRINFQGNIGTHDKVLRREFVLQEGDVFSTTALDSSIVKLNQLGFFDKIEEKDYVVKPDAKTGEVEVNVKVKEKNQPSISFSGGISGISGSYLGLHYATNNFMGRGESLELSATVGTRATDFAVSFTEPYLLDTRWSMGISLFNQRYRYDGYTASGVTDTTTGTPMELFTQQSSGGALSVSRPLGRSLWRLGASYSYQRISVSDIAEGFQGYALGQLTGLVPAGDAGAALSGIIRSEVTPVLSFNSTNSFFNPTRGWSLTLSSGISGRYLVGDYNMIRPSLEYRRFLSDRWLSGGRNTFAFRFLGQHVRGYDGSTVPFFDRLFTGGQTTIRGFDARSISPLAISSSPVLDSKNTPVIDLDTGLNAVDRSIISIGGDTVAVFNAEYRMPIVGPLAVSPFYDVGFNRVTSLKELGNTGATTIDLISATNGVIRSSTGIEIQFLLPVVSAAFRLIFAFNPTILDETIMLGTTRTHVREPRWDIKFTIGRSF